MPQARSKQVSLEVTPYYHCVSRCVRRAFLCGIDKLTGNSYEHRRDWLESRLLFVSQAFMIDIASYAVMNNHYHVVLCVDKLGASRLSSKEVLTRWHRVFSGNALSQAHAKGERLSPAQYTALNDTIETWRTRLTDISWFMRAVNERIARQANREDECTGRFWEGRFKSQALLDDNALLACMAYVDLNPVRAKIATDLETSAYTSIKRRLIYDKTLLNHGKNTEPDCVGGSMLLPFCSPRTSEHTKASRTLPFSYADYHALLEWTAETFIRNLSPQRGIKPTLLNQQTFHSEQWMHAVLHFESKFKTLVGSFLRLKKACEHFRLHRIAGISACKKLIDT